MRSLLRMVAVLGAILVTFHLAHGQLGLGGRALDSFTEDWLYDGVILGAAASCLARAWLLPTERMAWLALGVGLILDGTGEVYYSLAFGDSGNPPIPSLADLFYLLYYPAVYVALVLLMRKRMERFGASTWLDGAIAATTSAAVVAAIAFEPILRSSSHGDAAAIATTLAYPVGDLILLAIVAGVFALAGWRPGRAWLLLGLGLGMSAAADTGFLYASAHGTYAVGGTLDSLWLGSALAIGCAAWQRAPQSQTLRLSGRRLLLIPGVFALVALGVLLYGGFDHVGALALVLAAIAMVAVIARAAWTFHEHASLLELTRRDSVTDQLTGLGNRRIMSADLEVALAAGAASPEAVLVMFDLDGFKLYNDRFGHVAGDALLAHLAARLQAAVSEIGSAYRPGGDEFGVLLRQDLAHREAHIAAAVAALSAGGEGFAVGASCGRVSIPSEAHTPTEALRLADDRVYAQKGSRRGSTKEQTHDVLVRLLRERRPDLHAHRCEVGRLSLLVGSELGMGREELNDLRQAAELHDIGKAAIPEAILDRPGPLTEREWAFMRQHPAVGARILAVAPALIPIAVLVRSSHERWDGKGYPNGIAGAEVPLGARIVAVCDAFVAMTRERPYAVALTPAGAIAELRRVAGTQFDPRVVEAFVRSYSAPSRTRSPEARTTATTQLPPTARTPSVRRGADREHAPSGGPRSRSSRSTAG